MAVHFTVKGILLTRESASVLKVSRHAKQVAKSLKEKDWLTMS